jgi:hypothetical protein
MKSYLLYFALRFRSSQTGVDPDLDSAVQLSCHKAILCAR